jgi:hypothetical protein
MNTVDQNRFSSVDRPSRERIHGTRARASKVFGLGKSLRAEVPGFHPETHTKIRNFDADELAKAAANNLPMPIGTFYQVSMLPATETTVKAF